jgi:tetratricopeptide (TPR) repeat protein
MGSWPSAYQELNRAVELQPDNWKAQLDLGQLDLAGGKRQEATGRALLVLKGNPKDADAQMLLSNADALGNVKDALKEAQDAIQMSPNRSVLYINQGRLQAMANLSREAEQNSKQAQAVDPSSKAPLVALGRLYLQTYRYHLGRTYQKLLDETRAKPELEKAISSDPKSGVADLARQAISEISAS